MLLLTAILVCILLTGSPVPLFHCEGLRNPSHVVGISGNKFILEDGRTAILPAVSYIPSNIVMMTAIRDGIQIEDDGTIFGRMRLHHWYGSDPTLYDKRLVNLSCLAVVLDPECTPQWEGFPEDIRERLRNRIVKSNDIGPKGWRLENYSLTGFIGHYLDLQSESAEGTSNLGTLGWPEGNTNLIHTLRR